MRAIPPLLQAPSPLPPEWDELCPEAGVWTGCHPKHRVLQGTAPLCRRGKPRIPLPRGQTLSRGVPPAAPVASLGPLAFSEHSMPLLSALAGPDLPLECQESHIPSLLSLSTGGETGHGRGEREGREESPIVPQPSWDVWTQADGLCQRENTPPSCPRD